MKVFEDKIISLISYFSETQDDILQTVSRVVVDSLEKGGKFFTFGTGHSHMIGEELYARAGGLACIQLIAPMELTLGSHPLKSTLIERIPDYAKVIISQYKIQSGDVVLISSNSGRNGMIVEMALRLKAMGVTTVAFTNCKHSQEVSSRHPSGKRLFELCDYVIDSCGAPGDADISLAGIHGKMGATSSIIGMYMAQTLSMYIASEMARKGLEVPVFLSANVDEGDAWNDTLMKKYYDI